MSNVRGFPSFLLDLERHPPIPDLLDPDSHTRSILMIKYRVGKCFCIRFGRTTHQTWMAKGALPFAGFIRVDG